MPPVLLDHRGMIGCSSANGGNPKIVCDVPGGHLYGMRLVGQCPTDSSAAFSVALRSRALTCQHSFSEFEASSYLLYFSL